MSNCRYIQSLIDEAEQPAALPFEAASHIAACAPCQTFADERARLRNLLGAMPRVSIPAGYDARLKARLSAAKTPRSFAWFSPAGYQRFAAVAAVLVIAVFAAQYSGLFSVGKPTTLTATGAVPPANLNSQNSSPDLTAHTAPPPVPTPPPSVEGLQGN